MEITEVRLTLVTDPRDKLRAYCSITFDNVFVVRDLKVIEGTNGAFVAMPSRKLTSRCPHCALKVPLQSKFCNECGGRLPAPPLTAEPRKLHADIAHPINASARSVLEERVLRAYHQAVRAPVQRARQPVGVHEGMGDDAP